MRLAQPDLARALFTQAPSVLAVAAYVFWAMGGPTGLAAQEHAVAAEERPVLLHFAAQPGAQPPPAGDAAGARRVAEHPKVQAAVSVLDA